MSDGSAEHGSGDEGSDHDNWRPSGNPWLIAVVVTLAAFMELLDTTIVNVSLPHIAGNLSASYDEATWALTSYLVANSIVLPISAFFGRLIGRKRYFVICIAAFTVCSFLCGIATNLGELVVFRVLQGFFGGGLQPNQQSIILDTFPPAQRGRAFGLTAIATVVAPVLGPTVGGWITDNYSWRWVFFINVPIGVIATFAVLSLVEDPPWAKAKSRVSTDYIGIGLIALTFAAFQIMLDRGEDDDWFSSAFIGSLAVSPPWRRRPPSRGSCTRASRSSTCGSSRIGISHWAASRSAVSRCSCTAAQCWFRNSRSSTWAIPRCSRDWS